MITEERTPSGLRMVFERASLPLTEVAILWRLGSVLDPMGEEGATRLLARMIRRGPKGMSGTELDAVLSSLGARLSIVTARESVRIYGTVLARNTDAFLSLLGRMLREPAFRTKDFQREKRRIASELADEQDEDGLIAERHHRQLLFGEHPYGRAIGGNARSVKAIRMGTLKTMHASRLRRGNLTFALSGALSVAEARSLIDVHFGAIPGGQKALPVVRQARPSSGRRVRIVHKRDRTQCQLAVGTLAARRKDPGVTALVVGDYAFGGLFSSRLVHEVRSVRGWSYSAQSVLRLARARESWTLWTHPQADRAAPCAELLIHLMEDFVESGPKADEIRLAKRFLRGSRCLDVDTAARRTELALESLYHGLPASWPEGYDARIGGITRAEVANTFARYVDPSRVCITAVGDASELAPAFEQLPGVFAVDVVEP